MSNSTEQPAQAESPRLTHQQVEEIAQQYARFLDLKEQRIKTPTLEAELTGIMEYLANTFLNHAPEFIGCWNVVRTEYEPICVNLASLFSRVQAIRVNAVAQMKAAEARLKAQQAEPPANVTNLVQP